MRDAAVDSPTDVIIVAFHRPDPLRTCVPPLLQAGLGVVVVNVESDPEVSAVVRGTTALEVATSSNVGFAAAVNAGVSAATAPVVVFMNDDLAVAPEAVLTLGGLVSDGTCSVVVPAVTTAAGATEPTISALPTVDRLLLEWALTPDHRPQHMPPLGIQKWRRPSRRERIMAASAVMVACRRELLVELPLPTAYFLYWEESEWFWQLHQQDIDVWYEPAVRVQHQGGRDDVRLAKAELLSRNAVRCVRRTQGRTAAAFAWPVVVLWSCRLLLTALIRARLHPSERARHDLGARTAGLRAACCSIAEVW